MAAAPPDADAAMAVDKETPEERLERLEGKVGDALDDHGKRSIPYLEAAAELAWEVSEQADRRLLAAKAEQKQTDEEGDGDKMAAAAEKVELAQAEAELAGAKAKLAQAEAELAQAKADGDKEAAKALQESVNINERKVERIKTQHAPRSRKRGHSDEDQSVFLRTDELFYPVPADHLPKTVDELKKFVARDLEVKFPLRTDIPIPDAFKHSFYNAKGIDSVTVALGTTALLPRFTVDNGSENYRQRNTDRTIVAIIDYAFSGEVAGAPPAKRQRNSASIELGESATARDGEPLKSKRFRPDYSMSIGGRTVLVGEEKGPESELQVAKKELSEKLYWRKAQAGDKLPYIIAYAAAGTVVQWYAVLPEGNVQAITAKLRLEKAADRFALFRATVNICRLLSSLSECFDGNAPAFTDGEDRACGVRIRYLGEYVEKRVTFSEDEDGHLNSEQLRTFYTEVMPPGTRVPGAITVKDVAFGDKPDNLRLKLQPFGTKLPDRKPLDTVRSSLRCVLRALAFLHAKSWCHRDVRWPNVLQRGPNDYMLIDFEFAAPDGTKVTWKNDGHQPEEARAARGQQQVAWKAKHDLWQVGKLLSPFGPDDVAAYDAVGTLCSLRDGLTAEEALGLSFFKAE